VCPYRSASAPGEAVWCSLPGRAVCRRHRDDDVPGSGQSHNIASFLLEVLQKVKGRIGGNIKELNSVQLKIKCRLKSGNACYHLVQNVLCSSLLSKNIEIKIYRTIILPVVLCGCESCSLTLRKER